MKKIVERMMEVEEVFCNICGESSDKEPFNPERIRIVRFLFKTDDFHAHEGCINKITREAFAPYFIGNPPQMTEESLEHQRQEDAKTQP